MVLKKSTERKQTGTKNKLSISDIPQLQKKNEELLSKVKELSVLYNIARILGSQIDVDEALKEALRFIKQLFPIDYFLYLSFYNEIRELHLEFTYGVTHKTQKKLALCKIFLVETIFNLSKST